MQGIWEWLRAYAERWDELWGIVGAISSAAAVGWAVFTTRREIRAREEADRERDAARAQELAAERRDSERKRRAQAQAVVAWYEARAGAGSRSSSQRARRLEEVLAPAVEHFAIVANHSSLPVYAVTLEVRTDGDPSGGVVKTLQVLTPGREVATALRPDEHPWYNDDPEVILTFTDSASVRWRRSDDGTLYELDEDPQPNPGD